jgi:hypothetical protein
VEEGLRHGQKVEEAAGTRRRWRRRPVHAKGVGGGRRAQKVEVGGHRGYVEDDKGRASGGVGRAVGGRVDRFGGWRFLWMDRFGGFLNS